MELANDETMRQDGKSEDFIKSWCSIPSNSERKLKLYLSSLQQPFAISIFTFQFITPWLCNFHQLCYMALRLAGIYWKGTGKSSCFITRRRDGHWHGYAARDRKVKVGTCQRPVLRTGSFISFLRLVLPECQHYKIEARERQLPSLPSWI